MNVFEKVFRALNKARVKYLVVGGVAVNLHGYVRFTGDLDILVLLEETNLKKIDFVIKKLGYSERLPVSILDLGNASQVRKWLKEKNMKTFTLNPPKDNLLQIDIIIEESTKFSKIAPQKIVKKISGVSIPVISIDDLLTMKKKANRKRDIDDIKALLDIKGL